ncbi:E3 ubiquitin-protein ligase cblA-like [Cardiocondyla obscurior]|uniref:E3 ubiquitin-protein ligase cblA-like n=1 Tax=Cardiocondyla obscurior TaxID=286306 RepID=UPI00396589DF
MQMEKKRNEKNSGEEQDEDYSKQTRGVDKLSHVIMDQELDLRRLNNGVKPRRPRKRATIELDRKIITAQEDLTNNRLSVREFLLMFNRSTNIVQMEQMTSVEDTELINEIQIADLTLFSDRVDETPQTRRRSNRGRLMQIQQNVSTQEIQNVFQQEIQNISTQEIQNVSTQEIQNVSTQEIQNISTREIQNVSTQEIQNISTEEMQNASESNAGTNREHTADIQNPETSETNNYVYSENDGSREEEVNQVSEDETHEEEEYQILDEETHEEEEYRISDDEILDEELHYISDDEIDEEEKNESRNVEIFDISNDESHVDEIHEITEEVLHDEGVYEIPEDDYSYLTDTSNTEDLPFHNVDWNVTKTLSPSEAKSSSDICTVCLTNERTHAFVPCGHLACCVTCIKRLEAKRCPICNDPYETYIRIRKP